MPAAKETLERIATTYDSTTDFDFHLIRYNYREMRPYLRGPAILELGCASGVMTRLLSEDFPCLHVVDGSAQYLKEVAATVSPSVVFHHALFEEFKCPRPFNDLVMARALEHLDDPVGLLRTMRNWVEPGGRIHAVVPNAQSLHRLIGVQMGLLPTPSAFSERDQKYGHRRVYDIDLLRMHLNQAGWRVEQIRGVFLKPLSNAQMLGFSPELINAFFEVGKELPRNCAELYAVAQAA
jgi:trans-aconitate methyltransferase